MIVSDKTYTNLSNLTEEQCEVVIGMYQQWLDESGLVKGTVHDSDLDFDGEYWLYVTIIRSLASGGYKVLVGTISHFENKQEVTYEEIAQDAFGTPIDSRIEYWYKACDLINQYTENLELLDKVSKAPEDACIGDAALEILEEGLKLRQNKRKQEIEDAEYQARKAEEEIVKSIIERWRWDFSRLGFYIDFNRSTKRFHIICGHTGKCYRADNQPGIKALFRTLNTLKRFH